MKWLIVVGLVAFVLIVGWVQVSRTDDGRYRVEVNVDSPQPTMPRTVR